MRGFQRTNMQNNITRAILPAVMLLSTLITPGSAQGQEPFSFWLHPPLPGNLTVEQQRKLKQYVPDYIKVLRVSETQPQPPMAVEFNQKFTELCVQRHRKEYKKHGRWFYCEDNKEFSGDIRWDEVLTLRIYVQLFTQYGSLEKIPDYSKANHEKAIKFWQGWQLKDGSFRNPITGRGDPKQCNGQYIPGILTLLGSEPLYEIGAFRAAEPDVDATLKLVAGGNMNHGLATVSTMLKRIHEGQTDYIPVLERAVELALSQLSPHTGMFHGPKGNPTGGAWRGYGTTADTMKGMSRLVGYMGVENLPYRHVRADKLIETQEQTRKGPVSVNRNTSEMMVQCLLESPHRRKELFEALDGHSKLIMEGEPWKSLITGDYAGYMLAMYGSYLNWEGYENIVPRLPFTTGAAYDYRVEVGPFGRCVNVIKKRPEELLWDKNWSYAKYGLRARNTAHENRKVIDVVPASAEDWTRSVDKEGRIILTRTLSLEKVGLENPYLKIKWSGGDIEILMNGVFVKKKLVGLADFGAVHIPEEARKTLKAGKNTLVVRTVGKTESAPNVSAGLIDWK